jgi:hypothetical protein
MNKDRVLDRLKKESSSIIFPLQAETDAYKELIELIQDFNGDVHDCLSSVLLANVVKKSDEIPSKYNPYLDRIANSALAVDHGIEKPLIRMMESIAKGEMLTAVICYSGSDFQSLIEYSKHKISSMESDLADDELSTYHCDHAETRGHETKVNARRHSYIESEKKRFENTVEAYELCKSTPGFKRVLSDLKADKENAESIREQVGIDKYNQYLDVINNREAHIQKLNDNTLASLNCLIIETAKYSDTSLEQEVTDESKKLFENFGSIISLHTNDLMPDLHQILEKEAKIFKDVERNTKKFESMATSLLNEYGGLKQHS